MSFSSALRLEFLPAVDRQSCIPRYRYPLLLRHKTKLSQIGLPVTIYALLIHPQSLQLPIHAYPKHLCCRVFIAPPIDSVRNASNRQRGRPFHNQIWGRKCWGSTVWCTVFTSFLYFCSSYSLGPVNLPFLCR